MVCSFGSFTTILAMTLLLPILPIYVAGLGVSGQAAITMWSGVAYAATFVTAALTAPLWGRLSDRFGRKPMLIRASLGMAVAMSLIGMAQNVEQLVALRLLAGLLGGYASGSTILVAAQTPKRHSAGALGILSSAIMAGNIIGPLTGGFVGQVIGIQDTFLAAGAFIFLGFLGTAFFLKEERKRPDRSRVVRTGWAEVPRKRLILALLSLSALLMFAVISVEPIITVHIEDLLGRGAPVAVVAGIVFSLGAAGTIVSGPGLGRLADRIGHTRVLTLSLAVATILLALQAVTTDIWQFALLRLFMGVALGGVTPTIIATIRGLLPESSVGLVLGYNVSAQYVGQVVGPLTAGWVGGVLGTSEVFWMTAAVAGIGTMLAFGIRRRLMASEVVEPS